jgi:hypothetical protein
MSNAAVLVSKFDAVALRRELGAVPKHVRVVAKPPRSAARHALMLTTDGEVARYYPELRHLLEREVGLALFLNSEAGESGRGSAQDVALLAAETSMVPYIVPDRDALRRLVFARTTGAEERLIASVSLERGEIVAWSCEPRPYRVKVSAIRPLAQLSARGLAAFRVSESGSRVHWDEGDVDLGLDVFRFHADPAFRAVRQRDVRAEALRYAHAIRKLREASGLKQSGIRGLSEREVRRLESGKHMPQYRSLEHLAAAHGVAVEEYVAALAATA